MSDPIQLSDKKVENIRHLLVEEPTVINKKQSIDELLVSIVDDPRTRHVYVVNDANSLIGIVRMNKVVQYLFPFAAMIEHGTELSIGDLANFDIECVQDIMDENPCYVKGSISLSEMADILIRERINELPVVDDDMHLVGQINIYEVIMEYLHEIHNG